MALRGVYKITGIVDNPVYINIILYSHLRQPRHEAVAWLLGGGAVEVNAGGLVTVHSVPVIMNNKYYYR